MSGLIPHLSVSHSHVFLLNSRLDRFPAPSVSGRAPFSLSYGVILPSSLAMSHSSTFGYSPRPPVSVCGTGGQALALAAFLGSMVAAALPSAEASGYSRVSAPGTCFTAPDIPTAFNALFRQRARVSLLCPCLENTAGTGILTGCPSAAPFGSALGPDLPWPDYRLPGNLGLPVCGFPTRIVVTYAYICFSRTSSTPRGAPSPLRECSPTIFD